MRIVVSLSNGQIVNNFVYEEPKTHRRRINRAVKRRCSEEERDYGFNIRVCFLVIRAEPVDVFITLWKELTKDQWHVSLCVVWM